MPERVLGLARDGRATLAANELPPLEGMQRELDIHLAIGAERVDHPDQKTFPATAARCSNSFSVGGSMSSRAAMMPWTVSGSVVASSPRSTTIRTNCSA